MEAVNLLDDLNDAWAGIVTDAGPRERGKDVLPESGNTVTQPYVWQTG